MRGDPDKGEKQADDFAEERSMMKEQIKEATKECSGMQKTEKLQ